MINIIFKYAQKNLKKLYFNIAIKVCFLLFFFFFCYFSKILKWLANMTRVVWTLKNTLKGMHLPCGAI